LLKRLQQLRLLKLLSLKLLLLLRHQVPRVELASLVRVDLAQRRVLRVLQLISLQRHAQRPPLDVPRCLQVCHQLERLLACHLVRVRLQADLLSRHLLAPFLQQVSAFRLHLVSAWLLVHHVPAQAVSAQVLAVVLVVLVVLVFVLVLVAHAPVVLVDSVLVLVDLAVLARVAPVVLVVVLVLVLVLADLVVLVVHAPAVPVVLLAQAVQVAVHAPAAVLAAPAVHATVSVAHLARSHVHVAGANSTNCSRSSRSTRTAMLLYPKARSSSSVVGQLRSSLQS